MQAVETAVLAGTELAQHRVGELRGRAQRRAAGTDLGDQRRGEGRRQHVERQPADADGRLEVVAEKFDHELEIAPRPRRDDRPARSLVVQRRRRDDTTRAIGRRPLAPIADVVADRRAVTARQFSVIGLIERDLLALLLRQRVKSLDRVAQIDLFVIEDLLDQCLERLVFDIGGEFPRHRGTHSALTALSSRTRTAADPGAVLRQRCVAAADAKNPLARPQFVELNRLGINAGAGADRNARQLRIAQLLLHPAQIA